MAVIKELRWLAAAGECGQDATNHRLLTSDESCEVNSLRDDIMGVYKRSGSTDSKVDVYL